MDKIFPTISVLLNVGAAISYLVKGDIPHCLYWCFAGGLTILVTYFIK